MRGIPSRSEKVSLRIRLVLSAILLVMRIIKYLFVSQMGGVDGIPEETLGY